MSDRTDTVATRDAARTAFRAAVAAAESATVRYGEASPEADAAWRIAESAYEAFCNAAGAPPRATAKVQS